MARSIILPPLALSRKLIADDVQIQILMLFYASIFMIEWLIK
jgi:hypothetical protein